MPFTGACALQDRAARFPLEVHTTLTASAALHLSELRRFALVGGAAIVLCMALVYALERPIFGDGAVLGDFEAYYAAGDVWRHGGDPYSRQIWNVERSIPGVDPSRLEVLPFVQPAITLPLFAALSLLPYGAAAGVWAVFVVFCALAIVVLSFTLAGGRLTRVNLVGLAVFAAASGPLTLACALGQATLPAFAATLGALALVTRSRRRDAGARLSLLAFCAMAFKPNIALVLGGLLGRRRAAFMAALSFTLFIAANVAIVRGVVPFLRGLETLRAHSAAERFDLWQITPGSAIYSFGAGAHAALFVEYACALVAVLLTGYAIIKVRVSPVHALALAACALPFVSPFVHEQDISVMIFPALLCIRKARGSMWAFALLATVLVAVNWLALVAGPVALAYAIVIAAATALAARALGGAWSPGSMLVPLAAIVIVLLVNLAGGNQQYALWPDALPAAFTVPPGIDVSEVWHREQAASGLLDANWWWAILRSMTLAGCAALWFITFSTARQPEPLGERAL